MTYTYVCDGVNDEVEINAAIQSLVSYGGGSIEFSEGTFYLNSNVVIETSNIYLKGQGQATSFVRENDNAFCIFNGANVCIADMKITGGFAIVNEGELRLINCSADSVRNDGNLIINNCDIDSIVNALSLNMASSRVNYVYNVEYCVIFISGNVISSLMLGKDSVVTPVTDAMIRNCNKVTNITRV